MRRFTGCLLRVIFVLGLLWSSAGSAAIDVYEFKDEALRERYLTFVEEMRCPKCKNQNLAGSDSPIAADLRRELHRLLQEGKSDDQIVDYMVARYGDFILYKPRVQSNTLILWFTPLAMLVLGGLIAFMIQRGNRRSQSAEMNAQAKARLAKLLSDSDQRK